MKNLIITCMLILAASVVSAMTPHEQRMIHECAVRTLDRQEIGTKVVYADLVKGDGISIMTTTGRSFCMYGNRLMAIVIWDLKGKEIYGVGL